MVVLFLLVSVIVGLPVVGCIVLAPGVILGTAGIIQVLMTTVVTRMVVLIFMIRVNYP